MDATDFLDFAKKLDTTIEANSRSCVSRSYYCAYHESKKFIEDKLNIEVDRAQGGTHERLSKILINEKDPKLKGLGYKMVTFHSRRVKADYFLDEKCTDISAKEAITECEKILKAIEDFSS
ncbi:hypothetical protein [Acinetobacter modestus]|uniref:hypothetical protein n=1 Tax=Acinetobacter modestus TaxID=1776740 RepID=UPI003019408C